MQHFFVNQNISDRHVAITDPELVHQIKNVLRFRVGDKCILLDGKGLKAFASIESMEKKAAILSVDKLEKCESTLRPLRLFISLVKKPSIFETVLQKATELGVTDIFPLLASRCQIKELRNLRRLELIIKEAAEQCERTTLPKLHEVLDFKDFIKNFPSGLVLAGDARIYDKNLRDIKIAGDREISLVIGPEGGLTQEELNEIKSSGGVIFVLGENVLRVETAVIAALSVVQYCYR